MATSFLRTTFSFSFFFFSSQLVPELNLSKWMSLLSLLSSSSSSLGHYEQVLSKILYIALLWQDTSTLGLWHLLFFLSCIYQGVLFLLPACPHSFLFYSWAFQVLAFMQLLGFQSWRDPKQNLSYIDYAYWGFCGSWVFLGAFWLIGFYCSLICSFPNVLSERQAKVRPGLHHYCFPLYGQWRGQNGSSQAGVLTLPPSLCSGADHCMIQCHLQDFSAKATVSHS